MRYAFYLSALLNIVVGFATAMVFREPIATHFDGSGTANGWMTPPENILFVMGTTIGCCAVFALFDYLTSICPAYSFNVPNQEYWRSEEHLPETRRIFQRFMFECGVYVFLFMMIVNGWIAWANLSTPPRLDGEFIFLGFFLAVLVFWVIRLFLAFRLPKDHNEEGSSPALD